MLENYKVCLCFIVLSVIVCTVGYICIFSGDQAFVYFVCFLSMIIYEALYTSSDLRHNICSARFLDIKISTCLRIRKLHEIHDYLKLTKINKHKRKVFNTKSLSLNCNKYLLLNNLSIKLFNKY